MTDPEQMMRDLEAKAEQMRQRSEQMQEEIQNAYAEASSQDGAVTVRVAPNGALQHIEFSQRATSLSHVSLGQTVMEVVQRAQSEAARQISAIVEPEFGDTDAMSFLTGFLPSTDEDESDSGRSRGQTSGGASEPRSQQPRRNRDSQWDEDYDDFDDNGGSFLR